MARPIPLAAPVTTAGLSMTDSAVLLDNLDNSQNFLPEKLHADRTMLLGKRVMLFVQNFTCLKNQIIFQK